MKPALLSLLLLVAAADGRAQLKSEPAALDLGLRKQEQVVTSSVKLTNTGSAALEITGIFADCSCTAVTPEKRTLAPGESIAMKIAVETRAYQGLIHRNVRVSTTTGELTIPIEMTVSMFQSWLLEPATIVLTPSQKGHEITMPVALRYTANGQAKLGEITCTPDWLEIVPTSDDGRLYSLKLVKRADAPAGNHTVRVAVETSDPQEPRLSFNVFVPITSALRVMPNPAVLPTVKVGQSTVREIVVYGWTAPGEPRLELAQGAVRALGREGDKLRFEISVVPVASGPLTQLLRIYDGEKLEAEIPVILRVEPADRGQ